MSQIEKMKVQVQEHVPEPVLGMVFLTVQGAMSRAVAGGWVGRNANQVAAITATRVYFFRYKVKAWFRGIKIKDRKGPLGVLDRATLRVAVEPHSLHTTVTFWAPDGSTMTYTAVTMGKKNRELQEAGLALLTGVPSM